MLIICRDKSLGIRSRKVQWYLLIGHVSVSASPAPDGAKRHRLCPRIALPALACTRCCSARRHYSRQVGSRRTLTCQMRMSASRYNCEGRGDCRDRSLMPKLRPRVHGAMCRKCLHTLTKCALDHCTVVPLMVSHCRCLACSSGGCLT